ncbi:scavenger receptor class F member 1-like [Dreissena polymorpha]|uniref:scavenger receptor class F member 1-like n=1 Tax=Dreissena polymorpha TaxID=45954 RepID=UPI002263E091|nr:scavenger receptor class F member 1-like [Dreissena polymorpha]
MAACKPGYYGNACVTRCPFNCLPNANDNLVRCDFTSGTCTEGCIDGRFGPMCERQCNQTCAGSAKRCQRDGVCSDGCINGYYGDYCQHACADTCTDNTCDRKSGICADCLQDRTPLCRDAGMVSETGIMVNLSRHPHLRP